MPQKTTKSITPPRLQQHVRENSAYPMTSMNPLTPWAQAGYAREGSSASESIWVPTGMTIQSITGGNMLEKIWALPDGSTNFCISNVVLNSLCISVFCQRISYPTSNHPQENPARPLIKAGSIMAALCELPLHPHADHPSSLPHSRPLLSLLRHQPTSFAPSP